MIIHPKYLIYHDLIGFHAYAKLKPKRMNTEFFDIGEIIDETSNILIFIKNDKIKRYIKKDYMFRVKLEDVMLELDGSKIIGLPENRLRSLKKKKWLKK
jgi:RNase P/RNase MRP subunit p29